MKKTRSKPWNKNNTSRPIRAAKTVSNMVDNMLKVINGVGLHDNGFIQYGRKYLQNAERSFFQHHLI